MQLNNRNSLVYSTEKILNENRDKISDTDAKAIEDALVETKKAVEEGSVEEINQAAEKLTQASHRLAEVMYQSAQEQGQESQSGPQDSSEDAADGAPQDDEVIDAEYVDVDEKK